MSTMAHEVGPDSMSGTSASGVEFQRQEALLQTSTLQSAIFNSAHFSSIATDAQGVIQIFNVGAERMLGYAANEVINKITPADMSDPQEVIARARALSIELGTPIAPGFEALVFKASRGIEDIYELTYIRKDGSRFPAVASVTALHDGQDEVIGYLLIGTDNTGRKQAEASLAESQRRFREMADTFPFSIWTAGPDGHIDFLNATASSHIDTARETGSGIEWTARIHPQDLPDCLTAWQAAVRNGTPYRTDYRLRERLSDQYHWHHVQAKPVRDTAGEIVKWYGSALDIHETKLLEQQARSLVNRLNNTLESITDGFFVVDSDWTFTFLNTQAEHMLDRSRDQLLGKTFWSEFPQAVGTIFEQCYHKAVRTGLPVHFQGHYPAPLDRWYDVSAYPNEEGLAVYFRDVTSIRAANAQLHLLEKAVSRLNDIVLITEAESVSKPGPRIVFANEAFERRTGYTLSEVIGQSPRIFQVPKTDRAELGRIRQALDAWQLVRAELINYIKSGEEFWLELDIVPIADSTGKFTHWVAIGRDISERKLAEEAILRLNNELEDRVQRRTYQLEMTNKALEAFSYSVSHDLRSPLITVNGFTELLLKSDGNQISEKGKFYLKRIRAGSTKMGDLIDGLLSLAKISRSILNRSNVDLTKMCLKLMQELKDSEPDRDVAIDVQAGLMINADPAMLTVAMQNLIGNTWKYSGKAPHAHVQIGSETLEDGLVCIFVRDNGPGFDMAYADKLFEVYERLHQETEFPGTGIGLANVKRVVECHGGRIWAEALPGQGATFRFTLEAERLQLG